MRVISGLRKGHRLKTPKGFDTRPTEDRVKESLFNILGSIHEESIVLDCFSGTGSIGIEFLSRGAKKAYFFDLSRKNIDIINENIRHTRFTESSKVYNLDIRKGIKKLGNSGVVFDYIYLDPPFKEYNLLYETLEEISKFNILRDTGLILIEHEKELKLDDEIYKFKKSNERKYGSKLISFYILSN